MTVSMYFKNNKIAVPPAPRTAPPETVFSHAFDDIVSISIIIIYSLLLISDQHINIHYWS